MSNENITVRFGIRLKKLRKERGWTQVEMADALGIDRSYICDMECGKKNVCLPTLKILSEGLGITISQILSRI